MRGGEVHAHPYTRRRQTINLTSPCVAARFSFSFSLYDALLQVMAGWTTQMGFPLLEVVKRAANPDGSAALTLKQTWCVGAATHRDIQAFAKGYPYV